MPRRSIVRAAALIVTPADVGVTLVAVYDEAND